MTGGFVAAVVAVVLLILVATPEYDRPAAVVAARAPEPSSSPAATAEPSTDDEVPTSRPPEELTGYRWPLRAARVLTWFGPSKQGLIKTDDGRIHEGVDLASRCDAPVTAAHSGTVVATGRAVLAEEGFQGKHDEIEEFEQKHISRSGKKGADAKDDLPITVVIDDGNGYRSLYKHLAEVAVEPGKNVKVGTVIGTTGQSGGVARCQPPSIRTSSYWTWQRATPPVWPVVPMTVPTLTFLPGSTATSARCLYKLR